MTAHAHFVCRSCGESQCDYGDGRVRRECECGAATWIFVAKEWEAVEALPSFVLRALIRLRIKGKGSRSWRQSGQRT